jgi:hypothetical protein
MALVLLDQAPLADQHILLLGVGVLDTHPGGSGLTPLALTCLAVLILRRVLGRDPRIRGSCLRCSDLVQGEPVLNPVSEVRAVLVMFRRFLRGVSSVS